VVGKLWVGLKMDELLFTKDNRLISTKMCSMISLQVHYSLEGCYTSIRFVDWFLGVS